MDEENVFYVYEHWRPDKNVCFYAVLSEVQLKLVS